MHTLSTVCGIDIGKHIIAVHLESDDHQVVCQKNISRKKLLEFFTNRPPMLIGIESCGGSQYWARELRKQGHDVRLMNAKFVVPYRRKGKNDINDAEAICEAVSRPHMRFVEVKTEGQQAVLMVHRLRAQCVSHRKSLINQMHAYLQEFGIALPKGPRSLRKHLQVIFDDNPFPSLVIEMLHELLAAIAHEEEREARFNQQIKDWVKQDDVANALTQLEGIGPITASAIVATAGSAKPFKNGRQFAAWLGLVPRQYSSGGKSKLGSITKTGDVYVRTLLVQGARTVLLMTARDRGSQKEWIKRLLERRPSNVVAVAIAAKQARKAWAVMAGKTPIEKVAIA
jgi:transposase